MGVAVIGAVMLQAQCLAECIALPCGPAGGAAHHAEPASEDTASEASCHGSSDESSQSHEASSAGHSHSGGEPCGSHVRWSANTTVGLQKFTRSVDDTVPVVLLPTVRTHSVSLQRSTVHETHGPNPPPLPVHRSVILLI